MSLKSLGVTTSLFAAGVGFGADARGQEVRRDDGKVVDRQTQVDGTLVVSPKFQHAPVLTDAQRLRDTQTNLMKELKGLAADIDLEIPKGTQISTGLRMTLERMAVITRTNPSTLPVLAGTNDDADLFRALPGLQRMTGLTETVGVRVDPPLNGGLISYDSNRNEALKLVVGRLQQVRQRVQDVVYPRTAPLPPPEIDSGKPDDGFRPIQKRVVPQQRPPVEEKGLPGLETEPIPLPPPLPPATSSNETGRFKGVRNPPPSVIRPVPRGGQLERIENNAPQREAAPARDENDRENFNNPIAIKDTAEQN